MGAPRGLPGNRRVEEGDGKTQSHLRGMTWEGMVTLLSTFCLAPALCRELCCVLGRKAEVSGQESSSEPPRFKAVTAWGSVSHLKDQK